MTEAGLWDQLVQWVLGGGEAMMSFITIMFAFLVMAIGTIVCLTFLFQARKGSTPI
jgi:hypothetical protein